MFVYKCTYILAFTSINIFLEAITQDDPQKLSHFKTLLSKAKNIVILVSESFTDGSEYLKRFPQNYTRYLSLDTQGIMDFMMTPSIFWELYQYRRDIATRTEPKKTHKAIASFQRRHFEQGFNFTVATFETYELLQKAGVQDVLQLHGSVFQTECTRCQEIRTNYDNPIIEGFPDIGNTPKDGKKLNEIPQNGLPHCENPNCGGLLRPHVWWIGDHPYNEVWKKLENAVENADFYITIGLAIEPSTWKYYNTLKQKNMPTAQFAAPRDTLIKPVTTEFTSEFLFNFPAPSDKFVPLALSYKE